MIQTRVTHTFAAWYRQLRDDEAKRRIDARIERLREGNPGQHRVLQGGIVELKLTFGPGYRVYYTRRGRTIILLLCGGDKSTQQKDIKQAAALAAELDE